MNFNSKKKIEKKKLQHSVYEIALNKLKLFSSRGFFENSLIEIERGFFSPFVMFVQFIFLAFSCFVFLVCEVVNCILKIAQVFT